MEGPIFDISNPLGFSNLGEVFQILLTLAFFVTGVGFLFMMILGGIQWLTAGGDSKAVDSARGRITNAVVGLVIVVASYAIAAIIGQVFGISIVNGFNFN